MRRDATIGRERKLRTAYSSGTGVNISCSSRSISASVLRDASSPGVGGGSQEAIRRWLWARATEVRLNIMSAGDGAAGGAMVQGWNFRGCGVGE